MSTLVTGLHHVTACAGGAQQDIDFFTQVVGQRLIKQTILFDGRYAHYHLYYANANAEPGSVMTTFPYQRVKGRKGSGQISATTYTVAKGSPAVLGGPTQAAPDRELGRAGEVRAAFHPLFASGRS